jgi:tRNA pseudouridine38-40 synthase
MRFFLELQYDGAGYCGWQRQPHSGSVQETLEQALSMLLREPVEVVGSGRTDTGVHARQQFAHFDTERLEAIPSLQHRLNRLLPADMAVVSLRRAVSEAHARYSAQWRTYRYFVHQEKNPFLRSQSYFFHPEVELDLMNEAAALLLRYENFRPFSKSNTDVATYLCTLAEAHWTRLPDGRLEFRIRANRFLRGMVRLVVGTLLNIGCGKMTLAQLQDWMERGEAVLHQHHAGAEGLFLWEVAYPEGIFLPELLPHESL